MTPQFGNLAAVRALTPCRPTGEDLSHSRPEVGLVIEVGWVVAPCTRVLGVAEEEHKPGNVDSWPNTDLDTINIQDADLCAAVIPAAGSSVSMIVGAAVKITAPLVTGQGRGLRVSSSTR